MTPSQEAKEYAAQHGFGLTLHKSKRVRVEHDNKYEEFSGYPAALNYMRRIVSAREQSPVTRGALVACDIETLPGIVLVKNAEHKNTGQAVFEAVDKRVLEPFTWHPMSAFNNLAQAVGTIQFPHAVGNKRWRKMKRSQRKAERLEYCFVHRYDQLTSRRAWRVFANHQLEASCDSRKEAIAYVRSELAGQRGVTVQYV